MDSVIGRSSASTEVGRRISKFLIIADDITGSLDTGVQASKQNFTCLVGIWPCVRISHSRKESLKGGFPFRASDIMVEVFDTESRHLSATQAAYRVQQVVEASRPSSVACFYKKTDSTLRGNIGAELASLLRSSGRERIAYAPAFPGAGRSTRGGHQFVEGVPLEQTSFAHDPVDPVETSDIRSIIAKQSSLTTAVCSANADLPKTGRIVIFDASSDDDLFEIAKRLLPLSGSWAFGGSAGFAKALLRASAEALRTERRFEQGPGNPIRRRDSLESTRVLIVSGSLNPVSVEQTSVAKTLGVPSAAATPRGLLQAGNARRLLADRGILLIEASEDRRWPSERVAGGLGRAVRQLAHQEDVGLIIVFGGDTLMAVMRALNITTLAPVEEVFPGVPISLCLSADETSPTNVRKPSKQATVVASKAGGFGGRDIVPRILEYFGIAPPRVPD